MYLIGEFSRITNITVKALRIYHDKDILKPSFIDENTKYRYYSQGDVENAQIITMFKSLNFSLAEIKQMLSTMDDDADLTQILFEKKAQIIKDIESLTKISSAIDRIISKEVKARKINLVANDVILKSLPDIGVLALHWHGQYADTGKAIGALYRIAGRHASSPPFNLYFDTEYKEVSSVKTCLPVKKHLRDKLEFEKLVASDFYTLLHVGRYEEIGVSYAKLFKHIKSCDHKPTTPSREIYIKGPGMLFKGNPDKYITEIQIPIL